MLPARPAEIAAARLDRRVLQAQLPSSSTTGRSAVAGAATPRVELGYGDSYGDATDATCCSSTLRRPAGQRQIPATVGPPTACRSSRTSTPAACARCAASATTRSARATVRRLLRRSRSVARSRPSARLEMYFPTLLDTPAARISAFVDFGNVFARHRRLRRRRAARSRPVSRCMWRSPMGPISISYALPARRTTRKRTSRSPGRRLERLQFTFGGTF